ncbi:MAG: hypothetical protein ASARMPRED_005736 [Alectoria sarmentosa]|nr:MAG: hypothetical protein ASARMPRED_005736 [Alectoria sarmentosa]
MDVTNFVVSQREKALLIGDYGTYRKQLSRRLLVVRKKLHYTSTKGKKYAARPAVTAEDIARNHEFIYLLLLTSERAWALAMHMKSTHSAESGAHGITGSTKSHIHSRLHKASTYAGQLVELLKNKEITKATSEALLEAQAYYVSLRGAIEFEKQSWEDCLHEYSEARFIYTTLAQSRGPKQEDLFRDLLNTTIDPSIRYAAYQLKLPRTTSIDTIVSRYVPQNSEFVRGILEERPNALDDPATAQRKTPSGNAENVPKTIQWRSRVVTLEDAATAQALAAVTNAESKLSAFLTTNQDAAPRDKAAAYDEVLIPSQDAVDATKTAIDELSAEGVSQGDRRMQALQITRTAVNYALVGWRIGRNRILCGRQDGAFFEAETHEKSRKDDKTTTIQEESSGRKLGRLRERVVLYDSTLQSLDSVKELPGVAADQKFVEELEAKQAYFAALRCLAIGRSHALLSETNNALALLSRALDLSTRASAHTSVTRTSAEKPPNLDITTTQSSNLHSLLQSLVSQHRALVEIDNIQSPHSNKNTTPLLPLIERLNEYRPTNVDLTKLVIYPPKIEPIPVKPLFLDLAFNYIDYPGRTRKVSEKTVNGVAEGAKSGEEKKKGWFGFGR